MGTGPVYEANARPRPSKDVRQARQRTQGFSCRYVGAAWKEQHRVWLGKQSFRHPASQIAFQNYLNAMDQANESREAIEREIVALLPGVVS